MLVRLFCVCLFLFIVCEIIIAIVIDNKLWEVVAEAQRDADDVLKDMGDVVYFTDPKNKTGPVKK